jgi:hypothetical protein
MAWYDLSSTSDKLEGIRWYSNALSYSDHLATNYNTPSLVCAGVIAALSPNNRWSTNQRDTENLIAAHYYGAPLDNILTSTYNRQTKKAIAILQLETPNKSNITSILGSRAFKTRAFFNNIAFPTHSAVTLDKHMANLLSIDHKWLTTSKGYNYISNQVAQVAKDLDLKPHQLQAIVWITYKRFINGQ